MHILGEDEDRFTPATKLHDAPPVPDYAKDESAMGAFSGEEKQTGWFLQILSIIFNALQAVVLITFMVLFTLIKLPFKLIFGVLKMISFFAIMTLSRVLAGVIIFALVAYGGVYVASNAESFDGTFGSLAGKLSKIKSKNAHLLGEEEKPKEKESEESGFLSLFAIPDFFKDDADDAPIEVQGFLNAAMQNPELKEFLSNVDIEKIGKKGEALLPVMADLLYAQDEKIRNAAYEGLVAIDSDEARKAIHSYLDAVRKAK